MNFSGVSLHSPEIGVCQPKAYGDIQSHHKVKTLTVTVSLKTTKLANDVPVVNRGGEIKAKVQNPRLFQASWLTEKSIPCQRQRATWHLQPVQVHHHQKLSPLSRNLLRRKCLQSQINPEGLYQINTLTTEIWIEAAKRVPVPMKQNQMIPGGKTLPRPDSVNHFGISPSNWYKKAPVHLVYVWITSRHSRKSFLKLSPGICEYQKIGFGVLPSISHEEALVISPDGVCARS